MPKTIDLTTERRLTQLETQMVEIYKMFTEIRSSTNGIETKLNNSAVSSTALETQVRELAAEVAGIKKKLESFDTLSFLTKNPKLTLYGGLGAVALFVPQVREAVLNFLHSFGK